MSDTRTNTDRRVDEFLRQRFRIEPVPGAPSIPDETTEGTAGLHQGRVGRTSESHKTDDVMRITGHAGDKQEDPVIGIFGL